MTHPDLSLWFPLHASYLYYQQPSTFLVTKEFPHLVNSAQMTHRIFAKRKSITKARSTLHSDEIVGLEDVRGEASSSELPCMEVVHRLMPVWKYFPLHDHSSVAFLDYFFSWPNINLHCPAAIRHHYCLSSFWTVSPQLSHHSIPLSLHNAHLPINVPQSDFTQQHDFSI